MLSPITILTILLPGGGVILPLPPKNALLKIYSDDPNLKINEYVPSFCCTYYILPPSWENSLTPCIPSVLSFGLLLQK